MLTVKESSDVLCTLDQNRTFCVFSNEPQIFIYRKITKKKNLQRRHRKKLQSTDSITKTTFYSRPQNRFIPQNSTSIFDTTFSLYATRDNIILVETIPELYIIYTRIPNILPFSRYLDITHRINNQEYLEPYVIFNPLKPTYIIRNLIVYCT